MSSETMGKYLEIYRTTVLPVWPAVAWTPGPQVFIMDLRQRIDLMYRPERVRAMKLHERGERLITRHHTKPELIQ